MLILKIIYLFEHFLYTKQDNWKTGHLISKKLPSILSYNTVKLLAKLSISGSKYEDGISSESSRFFYK